MAPIVDLNVYLEKMMKVTPVYIIGLLTALEPALIYFRDGGIIDQMAAMIMVFIFGFVLLAIFELYGRRLGFNEKVQLLLVVITSFLYLLVGAMRAMGQNITALPFGFHLLLFLAFWTFAAPLILMRFTSDSSSGATSPSGASSGDGASTGAGGG